MIRVIKLLLLRFSGKLMCGNCLFYNNGCDKYNNAFVASYDYCFSWKAIDKTGEVKDGK